MLEGLFLHCTFQLLLVPLQFKEFFFFCCLSTKIISSNKYFILSTNTSFLQMVWECTLFSQISHSLACHSIPNFPPWLSVIICTCQLVMLSKWSLGFLLDKSFHPTRLCFHPSFSEAIPSQVSTCSCMFWALSAPQLFFSSELLLSFTSQGQHWGGKASADELICPI